MKTTVSFLAATACQTVLLLLTHQPAEISSMCDLDMFLVGHLLVHINRLFLDLFFNFCDSLCKF